MSELANTALLMVDMQPVFINAIPNGEQLMQRCRFALEVAHLLDIPVIYTEQVPDKLGPTDERLLSRNGSGKIFAKRSFSCLGEPLFRSFLKESQIRHVLMAGIEVAVCLYQTTIDLLSEDVGVTLLSDCIGGRKKEDSASVIRFLLSKTEIACLPSESVFYSILKNVDHPHFKEFTKLVKAYAS